jgi:D-lyxose ketol-isomerase
MESEAMDRRAALGRLAAGAAVLAAGSMITEGEAMAAKGQSDFYDKDGKFLAERALEAYYAMMHRYGYTISEGLKKSIWAVDFGLGRFEDVGMAGIFWWNDLQYRYFGHDIFLLPGQMIPEHKHVKTDIAPPKMEAWHTRSGWVRLFSDAPATPGAEGFIPASELKFTTCRACQEHHVGEVTGLNRPEAWHFMVAGPDGAIVTEYATYHDGKALRFTDPGIKF